jgi:hypothetical protein
MVMRYFGGGIGHLKNTPPQQVPGFDPMSDPTSEEVAVEGDDDPCNVTNEGLGTVVQQLESSGDVAMNGREVRVTVVQLEVNEDDEDDEDDSEDDSDRDEDGDQTDEDEEEEGEDDDYGYASA